MVADSISWLRAISRTLAVLFLGNACFSNRPLLFDPGLAYAAFLFDPRTFGGFGRSDLSMLNGTATLDLPALPSSVHWQYALH